MPFHIADDVPAASSAGPSRLAFTEDVCSRSRASSTDAHPSSDDHDDDGRWPDLDSRQHRIQGEHVAKREHTRTLGVRLMDAILDAKDDSGNRLAWPFLNLPDRDLHPGYYACTQQPRSLNTCKASIISGRTVKFDSTCSSIASVFKASQKYNREDSRIWAIAEQLLQLTKETFERLRPSQVRASWIYAPDDDEQRQDPSPGAAKRWTRPLPLGRSLGDRPVPPPTAAPVASRHSYPDGKGRKQHVTTKRMRKLKRKSYAEETDEETTAQGSESDRGDQDDFASQQPSSNKRIRLDSAGRRSHSPEASRAELERLLSEARLQLQAVMASHQRDLEGLRAEWEQAGEEILAEMGPVSIPVSDSEEIILLKQQLEKALQENAGLRKFNAELLQEREMLRRGLTALPTPSPSPSPPDRDASSSRSDQPVGRP